MAHRRADLVPRARLLGDPRRMGLISPSEGLSCPSPPKLIAYLSWSWQFSQQRSEALWISNCTSAVFPV